MCKLCGVDNIQDPNCIDKSNAQEFVGGTVNGVVQSPDTFSFKGGFLVFDVDLAPGEDAEFCIVFDPAVDFDVKKAIKEEDYKIKLKGGSPVDVGE